MPKPLSGRPWIVFKEASKTEGWHDPEQPMALRLRNRFPKKPKRSQSNPPPLPRLKVLSQTDSGAVLAPTTQKASEPMGGGGAFLKTASLSPGVEGVLSQSGPRSSVGSKPSRELSQSYPGGIPLGSRVDTPHVPKMLKQLQQQQVQKCSNNFCSVGDKSNSRFERVGFV